MAQKNPMKNALDATKDMTQQVQDRIEALVRDLRKETADQSHQLQQSVQDLAARSRENSERIADLVDKRIRAQLSSIGLATKADLTRLERRIEGLLKSGPPAKKAAAKKAPAKKAAAKKSTAKKAPAKKAAAKKSTAKKAPAKKAAAKKTAG